MLIRGLAPAKPGQSLPVVSGNTTEALGDSLLKHQGLAPMASVFTTGWDKRESAHSHPVHGSMGTGGER